MLLINVMLSGYTEMVGWHTIWNGMDPLWMRSTDDLNYSTGPKAALRMTLSHLSLSFIASSYMCHTDHHIICGTYDMWQCHIITNICGIVTSANAANDMMMSHHQLRQ